MKFVVQDFSGFEPPKPPDAEGFGVEATARKRIKDMKDSFRMTLQRCYNPNSADYRFYGGRGIGVCDRWRESFDNFLADMGVRPDGMTLERKEVDGDYTPDNCIWATRKQQSSNRRLTVTLTIDGVTRSMSEWAEITGISYSTLKARKQRLGYSDEDCINKSVKPGAKLEGKEYKVRKATDKSLFPRGYESRLTRFSPEEAVSIRKQYQEPGGSFSSIARKYGVSISVISDICQYKGAYA